MTEKRTRADIRREKFNKQGKIARDLADLALQDIDQALDDFDRVFGRYPGQIGGVACSPASLERSDPETSELSLPAEPA